MVWVWETLFWEPFEKQAANFSVPGQCAAAGWLSVHPRIAGRQRRAAFVETDCSRLAEPEAAQWYV